LKLGPLPKGRGKEPYILVFVFAAKTRKVVGETFGNLLRVLPTVDSRVWNIVSMSTCS